MGPDGNLTSSRPAARAVGESDWKTRSFWTETADYMPTSALEGPTSADLVIVGGGYTGLHTALNAKALEADLDIVVIDADVCGYGGSTRNGGFAMTMYGRGLADLARDVGDENAARLHAAQADALEDLEAFCQRESIDADIRNPGCFTVSNGPEQDARIDAELAAAERLGLDGFDYFDRAAIETELHSDWLRCGIFEASCRLVNPAKLVWGLRDAAMRRGIRIFESTPALSVQTPDKRVGPSHDAGVVVHTPGGRIDAQRGLVATNSYTSALPELRRYLITFYAYIILTEPLTDEQWERIGWQSRAGFEDRRTFHHYFRPTVDGRILWGGRDAPYVKGGPDPRWDRHPANFARLEDTFRTAFPQLGEVGFQYRWGGPIAGTARFLPFVGWAGHGRRLAYAAGYTGHGVGPSALMGATLADLLTERRSERTDLVFVRKKPMRFPPEWLRAPVVGSSARLMQAADDRSGSGRGADVAFKIASKFLR